MEAVPAGPTCGIGPAEAGSHSGAAWQWVMWRMRQGARLPGDKAQDHGQGALDGAGSASSPSKLTSEQLLGARQGWGQGLGTGWHKADR